MVRWLLPILLILASPAVAAPVEVEVIGSGTSYAEAVAHGLLEAIQQVTGVAVDASQEMQSAVAAAAVNDDRVVSIAAASQEKIQRTANGVVSSYRITETEVNEPTHVVLHISVVVDKFEPKGLGTDNRRSIAIASFSGSAGTQGFGNLLRDRVSSYLTQARRFAVVDRSNNAAYAQEMETLQAEAPVTERVRLGQVIGADYVVVGTIRHAGVSRSDRAIALTGERIVSASSAVEVDWQVLEIATRQVKWAGTVQLTAGGNGIDGLVDRAASQIAQEITQTIYPMRLIDMSDPSALVINQGAGTVHQGQRFRAMLLGKQLIDPYTKEPLGQTESEIAIVEIQRVDPKVSYARLVSGKLPAEGADIVLHPVLAPVKRAAATRPAAPIVVKLPGDP